MPAIEHGPALRLACPKAVIDIGANKGQFSLVARRLFPNVSIHAFEPLKIEQELYQSVVSQPAMLHKIAIGNRTGKAEFFITSRRDSSSLLPATTADEKAFGIKVIESVTVPVRRLDDALDISSLKRPIFMKIDVQGSELDVLKGAHVSLPLIEFIYCELSFVRLYDGQPLADEVIGHLRGLGFGLRGIFDISYTAAFGPTQADFLFTRQ